MFFCFENQSRGVQKEKNGTGISGRGNRKAQKHQSAQKMIQGAFRTVCSKCMFRQARDASRDDVSSQGPPFL